MIRADTLVKNDVIELNDHGDITRYLVKGTHVINNDIIIDCYSLDDLCVYHFSEKVFGYDFDFYGHIADEDKE